MRNELTRADFLRLSQLRMLAIVSAFLTFAFCLVPSALSSSGQGPPSDVHAVRFASIRYSVGQLVAGGDRSRPIDIAMMVWPIRAAGGRIVLVDAGFYREKFLQQWKPLTYVRPSEALSTGLGIKPEDVTDVILTHVHWDHADGADLFPKARVWIQRAEYEHHIGEGGVVLNRAVDPAVATMLHELRAAGRLTLVDGDDREIAPGVRVYTGGKHTFESQYVSVRTRAGTVVLASDNAYLYENLEKHLAIAQTVDAASNLAAQKRMATLAGGLRLIVPGHDPQVFIRFAETKTGTVKIE